MFQILQATIQELALKKYADHICDASEFAPTILSADYQYTCVEVCGLWLKLIGNLI